MLLCHCRKYCIGVREFFCLVAAETFCELQMANNHQKTTASRQQPFVAGKKPKPWQIKVQANRVIPDSLSLGLFSSEEIKKLSVVKIITPLTFNAIGHPLNGGLYDPCLGPVEKHGLQCTTCNKSSLYCPGHMGHIELPLPVVNPLFHKIVFNILKLTCLKCYRILITDIQKMILIARLRLLDSGLVHEAQDIYSFLARSSLSADGLLDQANSVLVSETLESHVSKLISENVKSTTECKSIEVLKNQYINETLRTLTKDKQCPHCKQPWKKISVIQNKIMQVAAVEPASKFKAKSSGPSKLPPVKEGGHTYVLPSESIEYLRKIWENEKRFLKYILPILKTTTAEFPTDLFFLTVIPVTPTNTRPINIVNNSVHEHPQNITYKSILQDCLVLRTLITMMNAPDAEGDLTEDRFEIIKSLKGTTNAEKLQNAWQEMQTHCDMLLDSASTQHKHNDGQGLKQVLEKKEGIIRMHMMGKRVNFAARTVITPDPNLNIDEIGIPEIFAKRLTYPVPVTTWNVTKLRELVLNGPDVYPGALMVESEDGTINKLLADNKVQREGVAKRLLTPSEKHKGVKIVHRHLVNGDILLLNRQPTLHRPSIMAHKARILKGEKTFRLHYANCKAYNADFDGDEMNAHFPQNEIARSEAYNLVSVPTQYLVPKDGTPLTGLIQDNVIAGVKLSVRGKFFNREDYMQLVFHALSFIEGDIKVLPPAIIKPVQLWSGKQVISTVIINIIPKRKKPLNLESSAKINFKAWEKGKCRKWKAGGTPFKRKEIMTESEVIIRGGELLCGVLDKTHCGATPYSLAHCMYELYGGQCSIQLLSAFAKLFTTFLQREGFTLGVEDILVIESADEKRITHIEEARKIGKEAATKALDISPEENLSVIKEKLENAYTKDPKFRSVIDRQYKICLDTYTNNINKTCLPAGLLSPFPENNLQLMVQSGAKGSTVNTMQISCLLGQIELEGKRPPLMISGRSLPSFPPYDLSPRAGGFIDGRFMTGIQPQEFFFHCMAGREGLVDTAVKTSRSGYLQRCLIKHLEGVTVNYDMTVRDSDGSVIQFLYGEDGMEVAKSRFLKNEQMPFLVDNIDSVVDSGLVEKLKAESNLECITKHHKKMKSWRKVNGNDYSVSKIRRSPFTLFCDEARSEIQEKYFKQLSKQSSRVRAAVKLCNMWLEAEEETKHRFKKRCVQLPDPITAKLQPDAHFYSITEKLEELIDNYMKEDDTISRSCLKDMIGLKSMASYCHPGEPVGLLAAQSVGEPSTQMTLNTFHFAGRGEMNVTLGIPRLKEVLMQAAKEIKTPSIEVPFRQDVRKLQHQADKLRRNLTRVTLTDVLEYIQVKTHLDTAIERNGIQTRGYIYDIHFQFLPHYCYANETFIKPKHILRYLEKTFLVDLNHRIYQQRASKTNFISAETEGSSKKSKKSPTEDKKEDENLDYDTPDADLAARKVSKRKKKDDDDDESSDEDDSAGEEDAKLTKLRAQRQEEQEYQGPEEGDENEETEDEWAEDKEDAGEEGNDEDDSKDAVGNEEEQTRRKEVLKLNDHIVAYRFDTENQLWCEVTLCYPVYCGYVDVYSLLQEFPSKAVIYQVPGIKKGFTYENDGRLILKTDGLNFSKIFSYENILDINKLHCNDIYTVSKTYGIEAAARILVKEITDVFKVYGITVDPRHLLLIADYMTYDGMYQPLNRCGMEGNSSPLQQMSFECSLAFMKTAVLKARTDALQSPSARLITGLPCKSGTGAFSLIQKIKV